MHRVAVEHFLRVPVNNRLWHRRNLVNSLTGRSFSMWQKLLFSITTAKTQANNSLFKSQIFNRRKEWQNAKQPRTKKDHKRKRLYLCPSNRRLRLYQGTGKRKKSGTSRVGNR